LCAHQPRLGRPTWRGSRWYFSLDHAGPQLSLRAVVGGLDLAGIIAKDQKADLAPADFGCNWACEVAFCRSARRAASSLFKLGSSCWRLSRRETGDISGRSKALPNHSLNRRGRSSDPCSSDRRVARQMRQTGLMCGAMLLLRGVTIRNPDVRRMAVHRLCHDTGGTRIIGLMHHGVLAMEHPMIRIGPSIRTPVSSLATTFA